MPAVRKGGWVKCLGWCNKKFYSRNKARFRFCPDCAKRRDKEVTKLPGIRNMRVEFEN